MQRILEFDVNLSDNINVFIVTHTIFRNFGAMNGPAHIITEYFKNKNIEYTFIEFPIYGKKKIKVTRFMKSGENIFEINKCSSLPLLKHLLEYFILVFFTIRLKKRRKKTVLICVNPLNAFFGTFLKFMGIIDFLIFHTADYYYKRYDNVFLNQIYFLFDKMAIAKADFVWNVSSRIAFHRINKQGVKQTKVFVVPNGVIYEQKRIPPLNIINKYNFIMIADLATEASKSNVNMDTFEMLLNAVFSLRRKYPKINLKIFGRGEMADELVKMIRCKGLEDSVLFLGLQDRKVYLDVVSRCGIGFALYNDRVEYNYFRDSVRIREYLSYGLPVITSGNHSLVDDLLAYKAGLVLAGNKQKNYEQAILGILNNYTKYRENAIQMAKKTDLNEILNVVWGKVLKVLNSNVIS